MVRSDPLKFKETSPRYGNIFRSKTISFLKAGSTVPGIVYSTYSLGCIRTAQILHNTSLSCRHIWDPADHLDNNLDHLLLL